MQEPLDTPGQPADSSRTNAAGRLLAVLDAFGPQHAALSLSEISRRAGLSLSTAHRLVCELARWGALERDPSGRYFIGLRLLELAALSPRGLGLREAAFPYLDDLHHRTRGNVHLGVRDGTEVIYVETIRACATHPTNGRMGDRYPMHATGTGLVLLALGDRDLQERVLQAPLERFTPLTVTDPAQLRRQLAQIRQVGFAVARGQITLPDLVVAVPVYDQFGTVAAAISVVVEAERAQPQVLAGMLLSASGAITRMLAPQTGQHLAANAQRQRRQGVPATPMSRARLSASALSSPSPGAVPSSTVHKRRVACKGGTSARGLRAVPSQPAV
jgi:DNA-binding IclR family transcriptional regulator